MTNYQYASNEPIANVDMDGLEAAETVTYATKAAQEVGDAAFREAGKVLNDVVVKSVAKTVTTSTAKASLGWLVAKHAPSIIRSSIPNPPRPPVFMQLPQLPVMRYSAPTSFLSAAPNYNIPDAKAHKNYVQNMNLANGFKKGGSKTPIGKLLDNKSFQNFSGNLAMPLLTAATFATGEGAVAEGFEILENGVQVYLEEKTITVVAKYWPENGGALGEWYDAYAIKGAKLDRIGPTDGTYMAEFGTHFNMRALPVSGDYRAYEVLKPFPVQVSITSPAFGRIGLGVQYRTPISVKWLEEFGYIKKLP